MNENNINDTQQVCPCCHKKATPRDEELLRSLKNRINRMSGQLSGISKMLDENRYCGDILIQIAALESALRSFGYVILQDHMETCVADELENGNKEIIGETIKLIKKLR